MIKQCFDSLISQLNVFTCVEVLADLLVGSCLNLTSI